MTKINNKRGRPTKFDIINQEQLKKLVLSGWDDVQVSDFFGVTKQTLNNYKKKNEEFFASLKDWKKEADFKVEKSLYQRALGYSYDEIVYEKSNIGGLGVKLNQGNIETIKHCDTYKTKITVKQVIPDVTAQIFWLKNRQPEKWRDHAVNIDNSQHSHLNLIWRLHDGNGSKRDYRSGLTSEPVNSIRKPGKV